jgi:hypothetical protein
MDDATAALAITGVPCAVVSFSPKEDEPLTQVVEWDDGVFPSPMDHKTPQLTTTISRTYVPAGPNDPDAGQRGNDPTEWIERYLDTHPGWTVLLTRRGPDGRLSFATFVRRGPAPLPKSVAEEDIGIQVEDSQDALDEAILSFGRVKLISIASHSFRESRQTGDETPDPSEPISEKRLNQAKADMLLQVEEFPVAGGKPVEWYIGTLVTTAVTDSHDQCLDALKNEEEALNRALEAHVKLRNTLKLPADDTGTYMARTFIST